MQEKLAPLCGVRLGWHSSDQFCSSCTVTARLGSQAAGHAGRLTALRYAWRCCTRAGQCRLPALRFIRPAARLPTCSLCQHAMRSLYGAFDLNTFTLLATTTRQTGHSAGWLLSTRAAQAAQQSKCPHGTNTTSGTALRQITHSESAPAAAGGACMPSAQVRLSDTMQEATQLRSLSSTLLSTCTQAHAQVC